MASTFALSVVMLAREEGRREGPRGDAIIG